MALSGAEYALREALRVVREWQELNDSSCAELDCPPTPVEFSKFVAANRPFVVRGYANAVGLPASARWTPEYLSATLGDTALTVAVTPNGRADAIVGAHFVEPCEERMTMRALLDALRQPTNGDVPYLSSQCSNLTGELSCLREDVGDAVPFAGEVLPPPDACNVWIGDERSVTSLHADPYENLYVVVRGSKRFTLFPPTERICLHEGLYVPARYARDDAGGWIVKPGEGSPVPWIAVDPLAPDVAAHPRYQHARPVVVDVHAGDLLYLPALWIHHVAQAGPLVIAVNWWSDIDYAGPVWALGQLCRRLAAAADGREEDEQA